MDEFLFNVVVRTFASTDLFQKNIILIKMLAAGESKKNLPEKHVNFKVKTNALWKLFMLRWCVGVGVTYTFANIYV